MYDLLIRNGTVIDGSGTPMFRADVAVKEERIVRIGELRDEAASRMVDASGCYVSPGFIDVNNHSDTYWEMFRNPGMHGMLLQGVTTVVGGNSGASLAPLVEPESLRAIQKWTDVDAVSFNWLSMEGFLAEVERRPLSVNFATLAGHGTIRRGVLRNPTKTPSEEDLKAMRLLLRRALDEGAIGFSTGLGYTHARRAGEAEIDGFLDLLPKRHGVYATYLRDEGEHLTRSVEEAIVQSKRAGVPLHISHLKAVGKRNWHLFGEALDMIRNAAEDGLDVSFDVYPYTASGSVLYTFLPEWVTESGRKTMLHRLKDFRVRQAVIRDMRGSGLDYSGMKLFVSTLSRMTGPKTVEAIARAQGSSPEDVVVDLLLGSDGRAIVSLEVSSPRNVEAAIRHPFSVVSSNGVGYSAEYASTGNRVHPRNFGTFPKVFCEYVRERQVLSWEEAVHKMTGKPAAKFGFRDRGLLREGMKADVVVFDPETVADRATMDDPFRYPEGIRLVAVNGRVAAEDGSWNGERAGEVIRGRRRGLLPF
ncbi:MAG: D-aminoacylase [Candidatus Moranbacteria bacterium]|nr:D-aminoacylase [Candidatus Moranbacteria bacterium]